MLASEILMGSRAWSRRCKCVPFSRLSLTLSHATLVLVGSKRASNEASTSVALRWSFRNESILDINSVKVDEIFDFLDGYSLYCLNASPEC